MLKQLAVLLLLAIGSASALYPKCITASTLNCRASACVSSSIVTTGSSGQTVLVSTSSPVSSTCGDGNTWYKVVIGSTSCYMSSSYLGGCGTSSLCVTASSLNMRQDPCTSASIVTSLSNGAQVTVTGSSSLASSCGDSNSWAYVSSGGYSGFSASSYLSTCSGGGGSTCSSPTTDISKACLQNEYQSLWDSASVKSDKISSVDYVVNAIIKNKARYQAVSSSTSLSVPWLVIGAIHNLEASRSFSSHLHNGDPLTARTTHVPAGRPTAACCNPPFTWEQSANDALNMKTSVWQSCSGWGVPCMLWRIEAYNGFGYRLYHPSTKSPYLWSMTNQYTSGKYVADGTWDSSAVSSQVGAVAVLKRAAMLYPQEFAAYPEFLETANLDVTPVAEDQAGHEGAAAPAVCAATGLLSALAMLL